MTATPLMMPKRRSIHAPAVRPVYSTVTGDAPRPEFSARREGPASAYVEEAHCFVCRRHADHFAEHDELVAEGLAEYDPETGSVYRTDQWDEDRAREVRENAYEQYASFLRDDLRV